MGEGKRERTVPKCLLKDGARLSNQSRSRAAARPSISAMFSAIAAKPSVSNNTTEPCCEPCLSYCGLPSLRWHLFGSGA